MIVDTDFPDHWKTRLLVDLLGGDEAAPVYVLRLWAHCQTRRKWVFSELSPASIKTICRYPGPAEKLLAGLIDSKFLRRDHQNTLHVHEWDHYNAQIISKWDNGSKGGRPKTEHKIRLPREDKIREDKNLSPSENGEKSPEEKEPQKRKRKIQLQEPDIPDDPDGDDTRDSDYAAAKKEMWKVICLTFRLDPVTKQEKRRMGVLISQLLKKNAAPWDIGERLEKYRQAWPNILPTPEGLVKHWDEMAPGEAPVVEDLASAKKRMDDQLKAIKEGRSPV